jgi:integrase
VARPHKIWFRRQTGWWMVKINGVQTKLARGKDNKREAEIKFHELMSQAARAPESATARTADVIEAFLRHSRIHLAPDTHRVNKYYCQLFAEYCGQVPARELRPFHVTNWINAMLSPERIERQRADMKQKRARAEDKGRVGGDARAWGETTIYNAKKAAFRVFSWAKEEGILPENPLKGMPRPKPTPRQRAITEEEFWHMYEYAGGPFRDYLLALFLTGARPKEVRELRWPQVRDGKWILDEHKTRKSTGKKRVIVLSAVMREMMDRLRAATASEFVFLNTEGQPWTMNAVRLQVMRLKAKLGMAEDVCAYLLRHGFGTRAILNGVDPSTLMELMGHTSLEMISRVYVHLADQHQHLKDAVEKVTDLSSMPSPDAQDSARKRAKPVTKPAAGGESSPSTTA